MAWEVPQTTAATVLAGLYRLNYGDYEGGASAAGSDQASAYAITKRVTVITGGTGGYRLPTGVGDGDFYIVFNARGTNPGAGLSNALNGYPGSGDTIFPLAANTRNYHTDNSAVLYWHLGSGVWRAITLDLKSDHITRTMTDSLSIYGPINAYNGLTVSATGSFGCSVAAAFTSTLQASAAILVDGKITPSALGAGPTADYSPTGLSTCNVIRQDMSAAGSLSGIAAQADGRRITLVNISTSAVNTLTLLHDTTSTAANRFLLPGNASLVIANNSGVELAYDSTSSRWRVVSGV